MTTAQWTVPAMVLDVHDGDTIRVRADLGWRIQLDTLVRLDGIDAPELKLPAGTVARDYLAAVIPVGSVVTVVSKQLLGQREKYGRVLADVLVDKGRGELLDVAKDMVSTGHAKPWSGKGEKP